MMLFWIAIAVALAVLVAVVLVVALRSGGGAATGREESPEAILKRRYARGEIDREEFQRRLDDLRR